MFHCIYVCVYMCVYTVPVCVCVCTYITLHVCVYVYICMGVCVCVCVYLHCMYVCMCIYVLVCVYCSIICMYICMCLHISSSSTHLLMGTWVVSISCQLQIMLQWTLLCFSHLLVSSSLWPMDCGNETSLSLTLSWSLPKFMSIVSVMPSSYLTLFSFCPQSFSASGTSQRVGCSHQMNKILELQLQHQSFQGVFRVDFPWDWLVWSLCYPRLFAGVFSSTTVGRHQFFGALPSLRFSSHKHVTNGNIRVHISFQVSVFFFFR